MVILATQSRGQFLFHEKMFESRLYFTDQLKNLGAQLVLCDPHRVLVTGPTKLHGAHLVSPDIRAGMALVIAALAAKGKSIIDNAEQLDRGYEKLVEKLKSVGADIREG
jgi:UDP-N-acetylglucosamine 1-carboxyvinyltransferase